jgi:hypothetical protein
MSSDTGLDSARADLEFVREAVRRDSSGGSPVPIALLWAAISLAGFPLADFAPHLAAPFWAIASPLGFALSLWLGSRGARAAGELDRREARRWAWHWGGLLGAIALAALAPLSGSVGWNDFAAGVLLVTAVAWFTAGVHLHRPLLGVAAVLAVGYLLVLFVPGPTWTLVGVVSALSLVVLAVAGRRRRGGG